MTRELIGKVLDLYIAQNSDKSRYGKKSIHLDKNGVLEDRFYGKNTQRSVLIVSNQSYNLAKKHNIDLEYGELGENILIDYNPYDFEIGTQIQIGNVTLEISQHCTLCKNLSKIDTKLPNLLKKDRGIFAKVIQAGKINKNDNVYINKMK